MVKFNPVLVLAAAASLSIANGADFLVRVRNLSYLQPMSPILLVAHTNDVSLFQEAGTASEAIQLMAENGDNSALLELADSDDVAPFICGAVVGDGPLFPGDEYRGNFTVDENACPNAKISVVSMLINTNDAFMGIDSLDLNFGSSSKVYPVAFDAGTEDNNELCSHMPGPACDMESGNLGTDTGEGYIHIHRGFHGVGDLEVENYDWRNPVAEVFINALD